ncbi:MAG: phosphoribosylformylglycinamidine synthase I [Flavobacteriales bacterium]|nr:phosphoribosylformylglycinamidine synthase I [Flavobacteriales bacterium]|tara:strand:+ start:16397 stop:17095 length:699 start_codon:yes stop_codon:yes gene_type:complete
MKFGVITFPGSNCDQDMIYVLEKIMGFEVVNLWHKDDDLQGAEFIILPGGFSYGDYLRSGAIANYSPIMKKVVEHANNGGYVLGICNGFQILCESKLLPGTLLHNNHQKFVCKNTYIKADNNASAINQGLDTSEALKIPIAHAEGRYFATEEMLKEMNENNQVIFRYCNENGEVNAASNPNGSLENIAGVCNKNKNVFGMMPHPERAADMELGNTDGLKIFEAMMNAIQAVV